MFWTMLWESNGADDEMDDEEPLEVYNHHYTTVCASLQPPFHEWNPCLPTRVGVVPSPPRDAIASQNALQAGEKEQGQAHECGGRGWSGGLRTTALRRDGRPAWTLLRLREEGAESRPRLLFGLVICSAGVASIELRTWQDVDTVP